MRRWFFLPIRQVFRRKRTSMVMGLFAFFLLFVVCLSLLLAECTYLSSLGSDFTGQHYAAFYDLSESEYRTFCTLDVIRKTEVFAVPVYAVVEEIENTEPSLYVTVYTDEAKAYFGLRTDAFLPVDSAAAADSASPVVSLSGSCLMPEWVYRRENYYRLGAENAIFLHGTTGVHTIMREMHLAGVCASNNRHLRYLFVGEKDALLWQRDTGSAIRYDVYIRTKNPSDYLLAQIIDEVCTNTGWQNPEQPVLRESKIRREKYGSIINYDYLDLVNHDICSEPAFFTTVLPVLTAAACILAVLLRADTEEHIAEYMVAKSYGAGNRVLIGMVWVRLFFLELFVTPFVIGAASLVSLWYLRMYNRELNAYDLPLSFGIPIGAIIYVLLLFFAITAVLLYIVLHKTLCADPADMSEVLYKGKVPNVRQTAAHIMDTNDPVRYMTLVEVHREKYRILRYAVVFALLTGVCAYIWLGNRIAVENQTAEHGIADALLYTGTDDGGITADMVAEIAEKDGVIAAGGCRFIMAGSARRGERAYSITVPIEKEDLSDASRQYYHGDTLEKVGGKKERTYNNMYLQPVPVFVCDRTVGEMLYASAGDSIGDLESVFDTAGMVAVIDEMAAGADRSAHFSVGESIVCVDGRDWPSEEVPPEKVHTAEIVSILPYIALPEVVCEQYSLTENGALLLSPETAASFGEEREYAYVLLRLREESVLASLSAAYPHLQAVSLAETNRIASERAQMNAIVQNLYAGVACGICLLFNLLIVWQALERQQQTIALIRQSGGTNRILRRRLFWQRMWQAGYTILSAAVLFSVLLFIILRYVQGNEAVLAFLVQMTVFALLMLFTIEIVSTGAAVFFLNRILRRDIYPILRKYDRE